MSDVATWKVHGPVKTLRTESATWDSNQQDWQPSQFFRLASFRPDGTVSTSEHHNPDGSIAHLRWLYNEPTQLAEQDFWNNDDPIHKTLYFYDEAGRHIRTVRESPDGTQTDTEACTYDATGKRTKVSFLSLYGPNVSYDIEGTDHSYGAHGANTMATTYDEHDLPAKVIFQDANRTHVTTVIFTRDSAGRILTEEMHIGGASMLVNLNNAPPEEREKLTPILEQLFGKFSGTTYTYDTEGRLLERTTRMGNLEEDRTTYRYDGHNEPIEEITERKSREANIGEDGAMHYTSERLHIQHNRLEYRYDTHGNWTEKIVSIRPEQNPDFQRSNIERRAITYHTSH
ncbi:MAG TPA: hypothetical protein VIX90_10655 [Edaphobacter sp.]